MKTSISSLKETYWKLDMKVKNCIFSWTKKHRDFEHVIADNKTLVSWQIQMYVSYTEYVKI